MRRPPQHHPHEPCQVHVDIHPDPVVGDTLRAIYRQLYAIKEILLSQQEAINELASRLTDGFATLTTEVDELNTAVSAIQDEIQSLKDANPALDLGAITAAVDNAVAVVSAVKSAADAVEAIPPVAPPVEPPVEVPPFDEGLPV